MASQPPVTEQLKPRDSAEKHCYKGIEGEMETSWISKLRELLGSTDSRLCGDFDNLAVIIAQLFKKVTNPPITVRNGVKVEVPVNYTIKIGGSRRLYSIFGDPEFFESLPLNLRKGVLDLMSLLLSRGTTYVVRFQCHNTETAYSRTDSGGDEGESGESLTRIFLTLLERSRRNRLSIDVSKRLVHLVGLTAAAGLSISDNRDVLALLQTPSELTVSLLQALKNMTRLDNSIVKANPSSFFNLGGQEAGIASGRMNFPFNNREYQFFTWFRVEEFENTKLNWAAMHGEDNRRRGSGVMYGQPQDASAAHAFRTTQHHVVSMLNGAGKGFDLFIQDKILHYYVSFSNEESLDIKLDGLPLRRGVWYHVAVTHQRASRLNMFSKDELTIHVDHKVAYQGNIRYPSDPGSQTLEGMKFEVGANFDGQISPVYFLKDALDPGEVEMVARADAGKPIDSRTFQVYGGERNEGGGASDEAAAAASIEGTGQQSGETWDHSVKYMDLMDTLAVNSKTVAIYSKVATAYHPARCMYNHALDVQGGRHALLGRRTQAWNICNVRDILGSLGGISCILPMFPRLLIDKSSSSSVTSESRPESPRIGETREAHANSVASLPSPISDVGFGTSWGDVYNGDTDSGYDLLDDAAKEELRAEMVEAEEDTCIALIFEILSNLLQHHRMYQREMLSISGPDMIEYAMTCVSNEALAGEGERCVLALHGLCTSVQELPPLHTRFIRLLFLNLHIWWRSSFHMQSSLMHLVKASLKKEPTKYGSLIDVHDLLTAMYAYYREVDETEQAPPAATTNEADAAGESFNARLSVVRSNSLYRELVPNGGGHSSSHGNRLRSGTDESLPDSVGTDDDYGGNVGHGEGEEGEMGRRADPLARARAPTEETVRSRLLSDESADAVSSHINYSLDNQQRKSLRWCIQSIIMAVVESSTDPLRHFLCLLDFIAVCKDLIVLDEVAQMLLILIVEGGGERANQVIGSIIETCHGAEEFTSFILRYIVHRPSEALRCTGIRIVTHFYLRLGKVSPALTKISLKNKRHGSNLVAMAVERLQDLGRGVENDPGLRRLQVCGGMALLTEVVTSHVDSSTINTYAALLEMLLTKPGDVSDVTIMHKNVFDDKLTPHLGGSGSGMSNDLAMTMKVSQFTARYLQPDHFDESEESALNTSVLPVFLELLPKLTLGSAQQQILSDLLSLLKHSESNRAVFCGSVAWHLSMFDIVSRYVIIPLSGDDTGVLRFAQMAETLEKWAQHTAWLVARAKNQPAQEMKSALLNRMEERRKYAGTLSQSSLLAAEAMKLRELKKGSREEEEDEEDTWFAIGMKVYATLLLHALQAKDGWHEVGRTLSLSLTNPAGKIVHFAVLSHLVNELTFIMQWRYRELQRLASSSNSEETNEALSYLDNIFSVFITTGQHVIDSKPAVAALKGWSLAKLRVMYLKEVVADRAKRKTEGGAYSDDDSDDSSNGESAHHDDEYLYELAEAMLVERATLRRRRDSLKKSEDDIPHPEYSGVDIGLGSTIISLDKNEKASMHPYLKDAQNFLDYSGHVWIDLGDDKNANVASGSGASAALEAGRKRFAVSDFLHPLGREQETDRAQLVLLLQNLRFFDVFFWPSDELPLRNSPMLRFHKAKPPSDEEEDPRDAILAPPITICMSVMCQALYVLRNLSPTNDLAELNVNRIHAVIESIDNVSRYATPVDDILLAALVHITTAMQTVAQSLQPFFEMIGVTEPVKILNIGLSSVEDDDREDKRVEEEELLFNALYEDPSTCRLVEEYFDTAPGTNVLHFIKALALALVSLLDMRKELLSQAMDEFAFNSLENLVDRVNYDLDYHLKLQQARAEKEEAARRGSVGTAQVKFKPAGSATATSTISGGSGTNSQPPRAPARLNETGLPEDYSYTIGPSAHGTNGGAYDRDEDDEDDTHTDGGDRGDDGEVEDKIEEAEDAKADRRGSYDPRDSVTEYGDIFEFGATGKSKSQSTRGNGEGGETSTSHSKHYSRMAPKERSRGLTLQNKLRSDSRVGGARRRSSAGSSRVEEGARTSSVDLGDMATAFDQHSHYIGVDRQAHFSGQLIIKIMQWLRDLYLTCNLNRSVGIVKSLMSLEMHEIGTQRGYQKELQKLGKSVLEATEQLTDKNLEEMSDLSNLSAFVAKRMASRHGARIRTKAATDNLKLKSVAKRWNDNMRLFGAEWSPWCDGNAEAKGGADGVAMREMSRHKDSMMRRMVMAPLEHGVDHRDEAYSEGKERDQIMFEMGLDPKTDKLPLELEEKLRIGGSIDGRGDGADSEGNNKAAPFTDILKNVQLKTAAAENDKDWGDSSDEDDEDFADESMMMAGGGILADDMERDRNDSGGMHAMTLDKEEGVLAMPGQHAARGINPLNMLGGMSNRGNRPEWTIGYHWGANERSITLVEASRITLDKVMSGQLLLTNKHLYFHPRKVVGGLALAGKAKNSSLISFHDRRWNIEGLSEVYGRRYLLQNCAIELFFADGAEAFFAFENPAALQKFFRAIRRQPTPRLRTPRTLNPRSLIRHSQYTELWRRRQISNFEYLMVLNVMAGRSYNDITQYPVFPWVISDYKSQILDLSGKTPGVFRDLSKPIGAINPERLQEILERYRSFDEDTPEQLKFMYGSHYSSAGVVVHYLLRQEPFTSLAINLQGGRFDCPDRLFFSMANCWDGVTTSVSDVKELIPELYCCPEVLMNSNRLPLGSLQEGGKVDDVRLPPWAQGNPFEFVRLLREALESDYVSDNLHHWIDLIFGYQQQGPEAIKAHNLFYYLTYENSVDIEAIDDPLKREAAKSQVIHFGQTPSQLFKTPHEARLPRRDCVSPLCSDREALQHVTIYTPNQQLGKEGMHGAVIDVQCSGERLVTLHADLTVCYYHWSAFPDGNGAPFDIKPARARTLPCAPQSRSEDILERRSYVPLADGSNDDTTGAGTFTTTSDGVSRSSSHDMLKKFSRGISRGFSFLKEAANTNAPGTAPSLGSMGLAEPEPLAQAASATTFASPGITNPSLPSMALDGHSLPPPPSAYDDSGNPVLPDTPVHAVTSPRRLSTGSLNRGSAASHHSGSSGGAESPSSQLAERLHRESGTSMADNEDRDSDSTFSPSPRSAGSNSASGVSQLTLPQTNHHHVALDASGNKVVSCGYWDHTMKVHTLDSLKMLSSSKGGHVGAITCLNHGTDHSVGAIIVTGGEDGTVRVWADRDREEYLAQLSDAADTGRGFRQSEMRCVCTLWGHTSAVTCLSYSADLDVALSASNTGLLCVHSIRKGQYLCGLRYLEGRNVVGVLVTAAGYLLASTSDEKERSDASVHLVHELHLFWINGQHLKSISMSSKVTAMAMNRSRDMLAVGAEEGSLQILVLDSLEFMSEFGLSQHGAVSSLWFSDDRQFLMVGSQDGSFHVTADPKAAFSRAQTQLQKTALLGAL